MPGVQYEPPGLKMLWEGARLFAPENQVLDCGENVRGRRAERVRRECGTASSAQLCLLRSESVPVGEGQAVRTAQTPARAKVLRRREQSRETTSTCPDPRQKVWNRSIAPSWPSSARPWRSGARHGADSKPAGARHRLPPGVPEGGQTRRRAPAGWRSRDASNLMLHEPKYTVHGCHYVLAPARRDLTSKTPSFIIKFGQFLLNLRSAKRVSRCLK